MKVRHIASLNVWMLTKGNLVLYRGRRNPWRSPEVILSALRREGKQLLVAVPQA
ncbi:MAG: hypothetical protein ACFHX7_21415 [Pseudomonadota bacterium]